MELNTQVHLIAPSLLQLSDKHFRDEGDYGERRDDYSYGVTSDKDGPVRDQLVRTFTSLFGSA